MLRLLFRLSPVIALVLLVLCVVLACSHIVVFWHATSNVVIYWGVSGEGC